MLSEDEFEEGFKSLKSNEAPDHDGLHVNIIKSVYELIKKPPLKIFNILFSISWYFPWKYENCKGNTDFQI